MVLGTVADVACVLQARAVCRMIDRVTVKGSNVPLDLYTVDIYDYPARFGCDCGDPTHVLDAEFESDPFVEHTQHAAPDGECDSGFTWFT